MTLRTALLAVAAAVAGPIAGLCAPPRAAAAVVLQRGHVDVGARVLDGALQLQIKDGTAGPDVVAWREPADVVFHVRPAAATTVPPSSSLAFLGAGARIWLLPQVQRSDLLWPGWSTEAIGSGAVAGAVQWTLDAVDGPGAFALFTAGTFGTVDRHFDSGDGLPDAMTVPLGTHAHGSWAFGASGRYRLTFTMRATTTSGQQLEDRETLVVTVGDVDPETGALRAGSDDSGAGGGEADGAHGSPATGPPPGVGGPRADRRRSRPIPGLRLGRARLHNGAIVLPVRLRTSSRIRVVVRPAAGGRALVVVRPRTAGPRVRRLCIRVARTLAPGRYRVAVRATTRGGRGQLRTVMLRVPARGSRRSASLRDGNVSCPRLLGAGPRPVASWPDEPSRSSRP